MNFFKPVYDAITNGVKWMRDAAGIDFYAFIILSLVVLSIIIGVLILIFCDEAKTARRLVKINNFLIKNSKQKSEKFFEEFSRLVTKGNNRVTIAWQGFVLQNGKRPSEIFKDSRIYSAYNSRSNFVSYIGYFCALLLFVFSLGVVSVGSSTEVLTGLFEASIFPLIIVAIVFIYSCFYHISRKRTQSVLVDYSKAISESIDVFFVDEKDKLAELKQSTFKNIVEFADDDMIIESEPKSDNYLVDSAEIEKQRARIRAQFDKEIQDIKERSNQLEDDIRKNREELLEVRNQIKETDDKTVITSLKQQEDSQLKLISALEKLKGAQQKQYIEIEAKLQTELKRIDETLSERRKSAEEKMKKELDEFADNLLTEKQKQLASETKVIAEKSEQVADGKQKNINDALSDLLNAMNKYTDK